MNFDVRHGESPSPDLRFDANGRLLGIMGNSKGRDNARRRARRRKKTERLALAKTKKKTAAK
jgi:hypothetical protein